MAKTKREDDFIIVKILRILKKLEVEGASVSVAELALLEGLTAATAELNILDGVTALTNEINRLDFGSFFTLLEDFHGVWVATEEQPVRHWLSTKGSGANTAVATTVADSVNGEVTLESSDADGATSANASNLTGANLGYNAAKGGLAIEARLKIDDIVEAYIFVGFTDVLGSTVEHPLDFTDGSDTLIADADNAAGIVFSGDALTQEWCHGGVKATTPTTAAFSGSAPVNATYVTLRVEISAAGAVQGFINGVAIGAAVAAAITAATAITPTVVVSNTAAAQTIMTLDYAKVEQNR